jgi:hypothetical protein
MGLDLENLPPEEQERLVDLGRQYSSEDTLKQANQTLKASETHGAILAEHGFDAEDGAELAEARDLLIAAGVGREEAKAGKKETNTALLEAMRDGKLLRLRTRSVLRGVSRRLAKSSAPPDKEARAAVEARLEQTRSSRADSEKLAVQLDQLGKLFSNAAVAARAQSRGGASLSQELTAGAQKIREAAQAKPTSRGTPAETRRLDLLDGIIIELTRDAREASRTASRARGDASIAKDFELRYLYPASPPQYKNA